jgi:mortality factor 4-like protein 1
MLAAQRAARVQPQPPKKKAQGSARGSEERQTSVSAAVPRGQKRMRDNELEKVRISLPTCSPAWILPAPANKV